MTRRREARLHAFDAEPEPSAARPPPPPREPAPRSVTETVAAVNGLLAGDASLASAWVRGEVSGFKRHASGHWYFSLKDDGAVLAAAMFRGANARVRFLPEEGMEVLARGRVSVYGDRSLLQLVVEELRPVGRGGLSLAFEQMKARLAAEGLFDLARKRPLPGHPRTVGVVTSLQAAALQDMVRVATERNPAVRLLVAHASVQGDDAPPD
ncbi:MAG TPA: exodeoxyribonuclease VII large subunit, partial [Candidatus Thermoplasmatota archaeon]|nr:exodeoxyribonuclease VII large subunit [Candidatus Thermoplasmatota archaeon]